MNIEHFGRRELRFVLPRMDAVDRADVHARGVLRADARFADDVGHGMTMSTSDSDYRQCTARREQCCPVRSVCAAASWLPTSGRSRTEHPPESCDPALAALFTPRRPCSAVTRSAPTPRPLRDVAPASWAIEALDSGRCLRHRRILQPRRRSPASTAAAARASPAAGPTRRPVRIADLHFAASRTPALTSSSRARWSSGGSANVKAPCKLPNANRYRAGRPHPGHRASPGASQIGWSLAVRRAWALLVVPARRHAQTLPAAPIVFGDGRVTLGGDVTWSIATG